LPIDSFPGAVFDWAARDGLTPAGFGRPALPACTPAPSCQSLPGEMFGIFIFDQGHSEFAIFISPWEKKCSGLCGPCTNILYLA
jgi:hypothetical protein